jgi:hypothetical protein
MSADFPEAQSQWRLDRIRTIKHEVNCLTEEMRLLVQVENAYQLKLNPRITGVKCKHCTNSCWKVGRDTYTRQLIFTCTNCGREEKE